MKLKDLDFLQILPPFMRGDPANAGLSAGIDAAVKMFEGYKPNMSTWAGIDQMEEHELDELAAELNISWYDPASSIEVKREIIKNSDRVQQMLGTKWAVENVIVSYFGEGNIEEWFEYEGVPGHFKVNSTNPSVSNENLAKFLRILEKVKRKSAHLDGVYINLDCETNLHLGFAYHEVKRQTIKFGKGGK